MRRPTLTQRKRYQVEMHKHIGCIACRMLFMHEELVEESAADIGAEAEDFKVNKGDDVEKEQFYFKCDLTRSTKKLSVFIPAVGKVAVLWHSDKNALHL